MKRSVYEVGGGVISASSLKVQGHGISELRIIIVHYIIVHYKQQIIMGNVAIAFIESTLSFSEYMQIRRQKRIEHKRIRSLIPRYLARLNNSDISITTLNLNGLGVDSQILRLLSYPLLSGTTRVQALYLENNWIGVEGATCIARVLNCKDIVHLKDVSLAHNPGE